ncbi:hypothetical protein C2S51_016077 [Perilla frutescens var. frutescens]|nr:hypothetical protein C2S51_016077 [Perilla frutescens var. frutescens]
MVTEKREEVNADVAHAPYRINDKLRRLFHELIVITRRVADPKVWQMCLYICIGAKFGKFSINGEFVTSVRISFTGLSNAILTQSYLVVYNNDSKMLILLITYLSAILFVVFVYTIREKNETLKTKQSSITAPQTTIDNLVEVLES